MTPCERSSEGTAHRAVCGGVERHERVPGASFATGPCLRFPRQGRFQALKYVAGLAAAIGRRGGRIFTGSHVVETRGGDDGALARTREGFTVRADALIVATNSPIHDRLAVHAKQGPYRTYAIAAPVPPGTVPDALYWDTENPYHYVRLHRLDDGRELLIAGGEDHRSGEGPDGDEPWEELNEWARGRSPIDMEEAAENHELKDAFAEHFEQTKGHVRRLEQVFRGLGEEPERKTCKGIEGLIKEGDDFVKAKGDGDTIDAALISAAQRVEHYEIAAYGTLRTYARPLGHSDQVRLLEETLDEESDTDETLTEIAESGINEMAAVGA